MKWLLLCFTFLFIGCVTTKISPQQRRAMQVKLFENTSYNNVFRGFKSVLQDEGYIIKNQDMQGGLILAHSSKPPSSASFVFTILTGDQNYQTGTTYEVSVNLEEISKNNVESRIIIQKVDSYEMGGSRGNEILDPNLYRNIYGKVIVEVERRKAKKR